MKLGYLAIGNKGTTLKLTDTRHPRKQLLDKLGRKHADKIYRDKADGTVRHVGYIVAGQWFDLFEIHAWKGGRS